MKAHELTNDQKMLKVIEQLNKLGYTQTDGLTYAELVKRLTMCRDMEKEKCIEYKSKEAKYWGNHFCENCFRDLFLDIKGMKTNVQHNESR